MKKLTVQNLYSEYLIMTVEGTSQKIDVLRRIVHTNDPAIRITYYRRYDLIYPNNPTLAMKDSSTRQQSQKEELKGIPHLIIGNEPKAPSEDFL
ncbi:hypothetical protein EAI77_03500 [Ligilactobacillus ruminis]|nr:hypothetical protein EAI77_03500 [Ligilactobacillus ruminis]